MNAIYTALGDNNMSYRALGVATESQERATELFEAELAAALDEELADVDPDMAYPPTAYRIRSVKQRVTDDKGEYPNDGCYDSEKLNADNAETLLDYPGEVMTLYKGNYV